MVQLNARDEFKIFAAFLIYRLESKQAQWCLLGTALRNQVQKMREIKAASSQKLNFPVCCISLCLVPIPGAVWYPVPIPAWSCSALLQTGSHQNRRAHFTLQSICPSVTLSQTFLGKALLQQASLSLIPAASPPFLSSPSQ